MPSISRNIRAGSLRRAAWVTSSPRVPLVADVPALADTITGYDGERTVRHGRAEEIRRRKSSKKLNKEINAGSRGQPAH